MFRDKIEFLSYREEPKELHTQARARLRCMYARLPGSPCTCGKHGDSSFFDLLEKHFGTQKWQLYEKFGFDLVPHHILENEHDPLNFSFTKQSAARMVLESNLIRKLSKKRSMACFDDRSYNTNKYRTKKSSQLVKRSSFNPLNSNPTIKNEEFDQNSKQFNATGKEERRFTITDMIVFT